MTTMATERVRVRGLSIHRPIIYGNTACLRDEKETAPVGHTHKWTVAIRSAASSPDSDTIGDADGLGHFIKRVTFKLHETYPNSLRNVENPPFQVSETGWGEFEVTIKIFFVQDAGEKQMTLYHHLKLHPWMEGENPAPPPRDVALKFGPVHSWQYDEIVFNDPFQSFLNILTSIPPTPLPRTSKKPVPYNTANTASLEASRGGVPEFTQAMEKEEAERLEAVKKAVLMEQERLRIRLHEREKELEALKQQLGEV